MPRGLGGQTKPEVRRPEGQERTGHGVPRKRGAGLVGPELLLVAQRCNQTVKLLDQLRDPIFERGDPVRETGHSGMWRRRRAVGGLGRRA